MRYFTRRIAEWLLPARGRHRSVAVVPPSTPPRPIPVRRPMPSPRSPYGVEVPLDGGEMALIRPYLTAYERERAEEQRPGISLTLADLRIGLPQVMS